MSEILRGVWEVIVQIFSNSGYAYFFTADGGWKNAVMLVVAFVSCIWVSRRALSRC